MSDPFSEASLLSKIFPLLSVDESVIVPAGDDCAVVEFGGRKLVLSVDQVIEGRHYLSGTDPERAGRKLMARNLSDIAAMGARPLFALISSASSKDKSEDWLLKFHKGVIDEAKIYKTLILGGDLASTLADSIASLTILGEVEGNSITRSGANDGDVIFVTGSFGRSLPTEHHLDFKPRVEEGLWIKSFATAMIDITDGLLIDCLRVSKASNTGVRLDLDAIPPRDGANIKEILTDGEDYELLFSVKEEDLEKIVNDWPFTTTLSKIGYFSKDISSGEAFSVNGDDLLEMYGVGFDHFK